MGRRREGGGSSDRHVWQADTFQTRAGCAASPGVQEGAAEAREGERQRGDGGAFQSSPARSKSAHTPPPPSVSGLTIPIPFFPPPGPSPAKSSDVAETQLCTSNAAR